MTEDRGQETCAMGDHSDRWLWEALLKQAEANLETARAMRLQTQLMLSKESAVDMEPDRLEAWFVADCDAEAGAVIAEQIVHHAEGLWQDEQQIVGSTADDDFIRRSSRGIEPTGPKPRGKDAKVCNGYCADVTPSRGPECQTRAEVEKRSDQGLLKTLSEAGLKSDPRG